MNTFGADVRLIDAANGSTLAGPELAKRILAMDAELRAMPEGLVFLPVPWTVDTICRYLAALRKRQPVALLDPQIDRDTLAELTTRFEPASLWQPAIEAPAPEGYRREAQGWVRESPAAAVHPDLALLMTTSGSTGAARMVRLSRQAVYANAGAIVRALDITSREIAPTSLPFHLGLRTVRVEQPSSRRRDRHRDVASCDRSGFLGCMRYILRKLVRSRIACVRAAVALAMDPFHAPLLAHAHPIRKPHAPRADHADSRGHRPDAGSFLPYVRANRSDGPHGGIAANQDRLENWFGRPCGARQFDLGPA
jgi:hypothetical protein